MRPARSALTTRGLSLLAAAASTAICAVGLGERDLLRVAFFLGCLPPLAALATRRTRLLLRCTRSVTPTRLPVDGTGEIRLVLTNLSPLASGVLLLEDALPQGLGGSHRFILNRLRPGRSRELHHEVSPTLRGRFRVGPLRLQITDPFGLVRLDRAFTATDWLVVVPVVHPLRGTPTGGGWQAAGAGQPARSALPSTARGEDESGTREYRRGDEVRRVHWRSTARAGTLMVRREQPPQQRRVTLLLDNRRHAHHGLGPTSSLEWAVTAVAGIGTHLDRLGHPVRLVTDDGAVRADRGTTAGTELLDSLAEIEPSAHRDLARAVSALRQSTDPRSPLIAVLGAVDLADGRALAAARPLPGTATAILVEAASWPAGAGPERGAAPAGPLAGQSPQAAQSLQEVQSLLRRAGWRVVVARRGSRLPDVWSEVCAGGVPAPGHA